MNAGSVVSKTAARTLLLVCLGSLPACKLVKPTSSATKADEPQAFKDGLAGVEVRQHLSGEALDGYQIIRFGFPLQDQKDGPAVEERDSMLLSRPEMLTTKTLSALYRWKLTI